MKLNMINCILLLLLLLVSVVLLKWANSPLVIQFLNFVRLFCLQVLLIIILPIFFVIFISPLVPNDQSCNDTFSFVTQIKNGNLSKTFLVSYDVTSLFTNIPLQETIGIAINFIFNHNPNLSITRKELKKHFFFATPQTQFTFNSKFYNQIDVVAMGSLLAPDLANIFMGFHETKRLNEYNLKKPKFYLRYVDDILAAFYNEQDSLSFLIFLK